MIRDRALVDSHLEGFTITNGYAEYAGGALAGGSSLLTVTNCVFQGNSARSGGAINSSSTFVNCIIIGNTADRNGGGISCWSNNPTLINCTIAGNWANGDGGGISCGYHSKPIITQCTITDNSANGYGGGVSSDKSYALIKNSILYRNTAEKGNQLSALGFGGRYAIITVSYSNVQGGQSEVYVSRLNALNWGNGNIDADPCFIDPDNGDYHLLSSSPCIDKGAPYYYLYGQYFADMDGDCRLAGESLDMGSDEFGSLPDSDADLLSDVDEIAYGSDPDNPDTDGDGLLDGVEILRGTNPVVANSPPGISVPAQYSTIQEALFLVFPLETITVSPATYSENLHFQGKNSILQSINPLDNEIVDTTIIDANGADAVITFSGTENSSCIVSGFTITNGGFSGINGNGCESVIQNNTIVSNFILSLEGNSGGGGVSDCDGVIQNNIISNNRANEAGGGIARSDGTIRNNLISNNASGYRGGGISRCGGLITGNIITGNYGGYGAGGIYCDRGYSPTITNCLIAGNMTCEGNYGNGGGIYLKNHCDLTITNCTIVDNKARGNYGKGGGIYCDYGTPTLTNCILWGNTGLRGRQLFISGRWANVTVSYSNVRGGAGSVYIEEGSLNWAEGNIDTDPYFVETGYWDADDVWIDGDYRLWVGSPCIDAGTDAGVYEDIEGNVRPVDFPCVDNNGELPDFDMGAYEAVATTEGELTVLPRTVNRSRQDETILAVIRLPEPIVKDDVDSDELVVLFPGAVRAIEQYSVPAGKAAQGSVRIRAVFDKAELLAVTEDDGEVELTVVGRLISGAYFYGTDEIRIIGSRK